MINGCFQPDKPTDRWPEMLETFTTQPVTQKHGRYTMCTKGFWTDYICVFFLHRYLVFS